MFASRPRARDVVATADRPVETLTSGHPRLLLRPHPVRRHEMFLTVCGSPGWSTVSGAKDKLGRLGYSCPCPNARKYLPLARVFSENLMLDAAVKALSQILSPPMRSIIW